MRIHSKILSAIGSALGFNISSNPRRYGLFPVGEERRKSEADYLTADMMHAIINEAESKHPQRLFRLYDDLVFRDSHVQTEFAKRLIAVSGDPDVLTKVDDSPEAAEMVDRYKQLIKDLGINFINLKLHLLKSCLWPVSVAEKFYKPSERDGWLYTFGGFRSVDATALKYDDPDGIMRIAVGDTLTPEYIVPTSDNYIIHRGHVLADSPDYWGGPAKSLLFWWLFKTYDRDWWVDFLERWGQPFLKGTYDSSDPESKYSLTSAFQAAKRLFGIAVSQGTEVEVVQVATGNADTFDKFFALCNAEISKLIVGQTISSTAADVGLGGGQASVHEAVRQDFRQFDCLLLSHTIRDQVFVPLARLNGWNPDLCPYITFGGGISDAEKTAFGTLLASLSQANLEVTDEGITTISEKFGVQLQRKPAVEAPAFGGGGGFGFSAAQGTPFSASTRDRSNSNIRQSATEAQTATDKICERTLDPYRKALGTQYKPILQAIQSSKTRADFLSRLKALDLPLSPDAVNALEGAMSAAAANGILQANNRLK